MTAERPWFPAFPNGPPITLLAAVSQHMNAKVNFRHSDTIRHRSYGVDAAFMLLQ